MRGDGHEGHWDPQVGAPPAGWLGPVGRAWWLGAEPERRPGAGGRPWAGRDQAGVVRTVFDDVVRRPIAETGRRRSSW